MSQPRVSSGWLGAPLYCLWCQDRFRWLGRARAAVPLSVCVFVQADRPCGVSSAASHGQGRRGHGKKQPGEVRWRRGMAKDTGFWHGIV